MTFDQALPLTRLIHENISVIIDFCFSRGAVDKFLTEQFMGEWRYLRKALFEISEQRATKAILELALYLRFLDDSENMSANLEHFFKISFGTLVIDGKPDQPLKMREVANKIIHASDLKWNLSKPDNPILICHSQEKERWLRAEVDIAALAAFCGTLMS